MLLQPPCVSDVVSREGCVACFVVVRELDACCRDCMGQCNAVTLLQEVPSTHDPQHPSLPLLQETSIA
jgi:hypothetical protein